MRQAFLVRIWDEYASNNGDWDNEYVALTREDAQKAQQELVNSGHKKTNITPIKIYPLETK